MPMLSLHPDDAIPDGTVDPDLARPFDLLLPRRSDRTDQFDRITVEVPPWVVPAIESIIRTGAWPWKDAKSFARSGVYLLIKKAQASLPPEQGFLGALDASLQHLRVMEYNLAMDDFFRQLTEQVNWFVDHGEFAQLRQHLVDVRQPLLEMRTDGWDGHFRTRWLEMFQTRYGGWL